MFMFSVEENAGAVVSHAEADASQLTSTHGQWLPKFIAELGRVSLHDTLWRRCAIFLRI